MTKEELSNLIEIVNKSEIRLEEINKDKKLLLDVINSNSDAKFYIKSSDNNCQFETYLHPDELINMYELIEYEVRKTLEVNEKSLNKILKLSENM